MNQGTVEKEQSKKRLDWIDGLKLFACIMVFFSHYCGFFYGMCEMKPNFPKALALFVGSSYNILTNGNFWMCTFCIISGYFAYKKKISNCKELIVALINRYLRFFFPFLCINFGALLIARTIGFANGFYGPLLTNSWVAGYYDFYATPWIALRASIKLSAELDCPLWMIYPLFVGTCLIYVFNWLRSKWKPLYVNLLFAILLVVMWVVPQFRSAYLYSIITMFGVFLGIIWEKQWISYKNEWISVIGILFVFVMIGGINAKIIEICSQFLLMSEGVMNICNGVFAVFLLLFITNSKRIKNGLEAKWVLRGKGLSFPIYVLHWLVLSAFSLRIYGWLMEKGLASGTIFGINCLLTVIVLLLGSIVYLLTVEKGITFVMKQWNKCIDFVLNREKS